MKIEDEPLEDFYPTCWECGEPITGDGYEVNGNWYCENCCKPIDGTDIAYKRRDARFEEARKSYNAE